MSITKAKAIYYIVTPIRYFFLIVLSIPYFVGHALVNFSEFMKSCLVTSWAKIPVVKEALNLLEKE